MKNSNRSFDVLQSIDGIKEMSLEELRDILQALNEKVKSSLALRCNYLESDFAAFLEDAASDCAFQIKKEQDQAEHDMRNDQFAQAILAELGAEPCDPRSFNQDDWYTYNTQTLQCLPDNGSSKHNHWQEPAPFKVVRGMAAASLGLWRYKDEKRHNSIIIKETLANMELMGVDV